MELVSIFKALADKTRLEILKVIVRQEICVCDLTELFNLSQPTISHHLKVLSEVGLINIEKRGKWCFYNINKDAVIDLYQSLDGLFFKDQIEIKLSSCSCDGMRNLNNED